MLVSPFGKVNVSTLSSYLSQVLTLPIFLGSSPGCSILTGRFPVCKSMIFISTTTEKCDTNLTEKVNPGGPLRHDPDGVDSDGILFTE